MTTAEAAQSEPSVREQLAGMWGFLRRALRFWRLLLLAVLLGGGAFAVFLRFYQAKYRSETVILYVDKGDSEQQAESSDAQRNVSLRLKELLYARPNLERIVSRFKLYPELRKGYGMVDAAEELKKHIDFRAPGGDTFSIAFEGGAPTEAQAVTAELGRLVIDGDAQLRTSQSKVALDFLVGERAAREAELRAAEEQLAFFMAQHPRFALDATPLANGAAIRATLGAAISTGAVVNRPPFAGRQQSGLVGGASSPQVSPTSGNIPVKTSDGEEARARAALAAARENLTEKLVHYTPAHPDVRAAESEVQRATARLAAVSATAASPATMGSPGGALGSNPAATPSAATPAATPRVALAPRAAAPSVAPVPSAEHAPDLVELETEWLKLTRAVSEARQRLDQVEAQLFRADMQASTESAGHAVQVTIIDPAFLPQRPLPPGKISLALIFLGAALALGGFSMLLAALLDERMFEARDAGAVAEVLVEVPRASGRNAYVAS